MLFMNAMFAALFGESVWAVIQAILLLLLAFLSAAIVKSLTLKLLTRTALRSLLCRHDPAGWDNVAAFAGKLLHLIVFLLFIPGISERLGMTGVSSPILGILNTMWGYLPNILAAVVVLWAGVFAAKLVRDLLIPVFDKLKISTAVLNQPLAGKSGDYRGGVRQIVQHPGVHRVCADFNPRDHHGAAGFEDQRGLRPGGSDAEHSLCLYPQHSGGLDNCRGGVHGGEALREHCGAADWRQRPE